jgi:hypothetical protein
MTDCNNCGANDFVYDVCSYCGSATAALLATAQSQMLPRAVIDQANSISAVNMPTAWGNLFMYRGTDKPEVTVDGRWFLPWVG